jgi:hypothetical protein
MPLTLSIETLGGISTPLILRGTPLPAKRSQVFSTAADNQEAITIKTYIGERALAKNNLVVSTVELLGIPSAPRGIPQIQITYEIDQECKLNIRAVEKESDKKLTVNVDKPVIGTSKDDIEKHLKEAEANREADKKQLNLIESRNNADSLIAKAERFLQEKQDAGFKGKSIEEINEILAELGLALENKDSEKIRVKTSELELKLTTSEQSLGHENLFGNNFGDIFDDVFGKPSKQRATKKSDNFAASSQKETVTKGKSPQQSPIDREQLETHEGINSQIGKIFGGSNFTPDPNLCFVLMPFLEELSPVFEDHIKPTVTSQSLSCIRADEIVGTKLITWDIWEHVNRARFIIADLTGQNANVFYEVGLAHALGKEVVLLTQSMDDVPFDLQSLRCMLYSYTPRGMKEMEKKLSTTIQEIMHST